MSEIDFETDSLAALITEALRAGPGSPSWHAALEQLQAAGAAHHDEYRLLMTARQQLEHGRAYRSVRAGPAFTKQLMASLGETDVPTRKPRVVQIIAIICGVGLLITTAMIAYMLSTAAKRPDAQQVTLLVQPLASLNFNSALPPDWVRHGTVDLQLEGGALKFASALPTDPAGGAIAWSQPLPGNEPVALLAQLHVNREDENVIAQLFVTDDPQFDPGNATTPHELVVLLSGKTAQLMLPGGRIEAQVEPGKHPRGNLSLQITLDGTRADVDVAGKRLWSGTPGLDSAKPHYVGLRFLTRGNPAGSTGAADSVVFQSLSVNVAPR